MRVSPSSSWPTTFPPVVSFRLVVSSIADDHARHRLSLGGSEKMQLTALLGAFKIAVELSQKKAK
jgi:hypothetical protein